jgi:hypothetical protein
MLFVQGHEASVNVTNLPKQMTHENSMELGRKCKLMFSHTQKGIAHGRQLERTYRVLQTYS